MSLDENNKLMVYKNGQIQTLKEWEEVNKFLDPFFNASQLYLHEIGDFDYKIDAPNQNLEGIKAVQWREISTSPIDTPENYRSRSSLIIARYLFYVQHDYSFQRRFLSNPATNNGAVPALLNALFQYVGATLNVLSYTGLDRKPFNKGKDAFAICQTINVLHVKKITEYFPIEIALKKDEIMMFPVIDKQRLAEVKNGTGKKLFNL